MKLCTIIPKKVTIKKSKQDLKYSTKNYVSFQSESLVQIQRLQIDLGLPIHITIVSCNCPTKDNFLYQIRVKPTLEENCKTSIDVFTDLNLYFPPKWASLRFGSRIDHFQSQRLLPLINFSITTSPHCTVYSTLAGAQEMGGWAEWTIARFWQIS